MSSTKSYDQIYQELNNHVSKFSVQPTLTQPTIQPLSFLDKVWLKMQSNVYILVPIVVLIVLLVVKPRFVTYETEEGYRIHTTNLVMWACVISLPICLVIFIYVYKKDNGVSTASG